MYRGVTNSPKTELVALITETDTEIEVNDISVLLPNEGVAVIGNGDVAETVKYLEVEGNVLKGCIRGYEGIARSWTAGTRVARNFAASDWNTAIDNIEGLYGRFDDEKTVPLTLQPGLQVVTAAKDARFKLNQITGKTEINGQGRTGIVGVENPYVIDTAGNLLPPFYEWALNEDAKITNPYELTLKTDNAYSGSTIKIPFIAGQTYRLSATMSPSAKLYAHEISATGEHTYHLCVDGFVVFEVAEDTETLEILATNDTTTDTEITFKNPMLTIGDAPKPFQPQRKSMLAFQTELHANPTDGSDPDVLFEQGGQYFKLAKWKKVVLDGSLNYTVYGSKDGFRTISTPVPGAVYPSTVTDTIGEMTKYDGKLLTKNDAFNINDSWYLNGAIKSATLSIPSTDSGWGDDYEPTQDEIKAYFNGYKMFTVGQGHTSTYNGTGVKAWVAIIDISAPEGPADTQILPTGTYSQWTPYQLLYRLAKESVEPIVSEGSLLLTEGDNMVEVGTGIVLRERANPSYANQSGYYVIANDGFGANGTYLKYKPLNILHIYKNDRDDNGWTIRRNYSEANAQGLSDAYTTPANFDQSAAYSVTYLKLDKSPIVPIAGSLAANEKAQISDLTVSVAEALRRVSVVEQKKADEDVPGRLTPTLLNNWSGIVQYTKTSSGLVIITGRALAGAYTNGIILFVLPAGYRPLGDIVFPSLGSTGSALFNCEVSISADGKVTLWAAQGNQYINLYLPPFLAIQ